MDKENFIKILDFKVFKNSLKEAVEYIENLDKVHIISGNPEVLYTSLKNELLFKNFISKKAFIIPDGVGTQIAARVLKTPVKEKIAGIDLMSEIIKRAEKDEKKIYLLGANDENLKICISNLITKYPKLNIVGYSNGYFDFNKTKEIIDDIKNKDPYILFVAMGCPKQEEFIIKYMDSLPCKVFMGVGGSFDVIAEKVNRAPKWMINLGLEWLYRVLKEPCRIKRLGSIPKFLFISIFNKRKLS